jgi:glutaminase
MPAGDTGPATAWPDRYVSTGHLPAADRVEALVDEAHDRFGSDTAGEVSTVYPALASAAAHLFGVCVVRTDGSAHSAGDADAPFTIMSVAKPFVFALVCEALGAEEVRHRVGVNATGLPFNSLAAIEQGPDGVTNPMVNPGAIATAGLVPGVDVDERWARLLDGLSRFAGRRLAIDEGVYASASATNHRNRSMARLLHDYGRVAGDPDAVVDLYTRQSCLTVTARDLAVMGATLADGGVNPLTGERVVDAETCRYTLAVMATAGLYETSGDWLYTIGLPAKSGIGGGIVTAAPGKGGLGTYAPLLDAAGNSVKGRLAARFLSDRLGLNLFVSAPEPAAGGA